MRSGPAWGKNGTASQADAGERWGCLVQDRASRVVVACATGPLSENLIAQAVTTTVQRTQRRALSWFSAGWHGYHPEIRPIVIITHNEEKPLPTAFLRRCIFHYLEFPRRKTQLEDILALHDIRDEQLSEKAIAILLKLREPELSLSKKPGLSELLDWAGFLDAKKIPMEDLDKLPYLEALLKQRSDQQRAREVFKE